MKYDLYEDLNLDRSADSSTIAQLLSQRLSITASPEEQDKLSTARAILGNPSNRSVYDAELDDASRTSLDISRLREIAAMNAPAQQGWNPAPRQQLQFDTNWFPVAPGRQRSSSLMWAIGTGLIVLAWVYLFLKMAFLSSAVQQSTGFTGLFEAADALDSASATAFNVVLFTVCTGVGLQLLWNIRMVMGRRKGLSE
ncbi:hypothetical protein [Corynebacterium gerontici]|uniref:J domain-containing protein n=1 Tax=Corynebacterium gerontici TaxID=2079234 RepID=A0A3G6J2W8_9CORY|nr:hypothetical protein [Corynebacterium gerontici]AZA12367.1 hypothetical protein CGERO_10435 [Corynebacterium gerontici]